MQPLRVVDDSDHILKQERQACAVPAVPLGLGNIKFLNELLRLLLSDRPVPRPI